VNGGFFIMRQEVFDYMRPGEELVFEPFDRIIGDGRLHGYRHTGFWTSMDTFKDKKRLDDMYARGERPWEVWNSASTRRNAYEEMLTPYAAGRT
jgi:glucose-1-phosphate cytidylyltransferase